MTWLAISARPNAEGKDYRMLRAKAVECISLVGMAVGKERFAAGPYNRSLSCPTSGYFNRGQGRHGSEKARETLPCV